MELVYLEIRHKQAWDQMVKQAHGSGFMQSWAWGAWKENSGQKVVRLGVMEGQRLIGGATAYLVASALGSSPLMVPQGPVLPWQDLDSAKAARELLLNELQLIAHREKCPILRLEPGISNEQKQIFFPQARRAPIDLVPTPSLMVDIDMTEQDILKQMKPKGRYNIKRASGKGVETQWGTSQEDLASFYELFDLTCIRHRFIGEQREFFEGLVHHLSKEDMVRIYLSRYRGNVVSAAIVLMYGQTATYLYGGSSPFFSGSMASYDLHWTAMRDARKQGCRYYDFYGIAPEDNLFHPYVRFTAFKKKFGGRVVAHAGAQDIIFYEQLSATWLKHLEAMKEEVCQTS